MKKIRKYILPAAGVFILYLILSVMLVYIRQPAVSREYQEAFDPVDCYSDTESCDRAYVIEDNSEALAERVRMIEQAEKRIILSTFEFRADESGKDILAALIHAAGRGVEVRVLVDGFPALLQMKGNPYFQALSTMEQAEIKLYNQVNLLMPWKSMGRLHDKYLIVDDYLYLLGGRNTYDYFLGDNGYKNYDRDVLVYSMEPENEESSIHQLIDYFESVWEQETCRYFYNHQEKASKAQIVQAREELEERYLELQETYALREAPDYEQMTFAVNRITLLSNPIHVYAKEPEVFYALTQLMKESEEEITIHTPYIICNDWMYEELRAICAGNRHVNLMTNSAANNGNPFGASDYILNKGKLLDTGLTIYEYEGGVSYHGKSITIGDDLAIVGSFNMDMRSVYLDTELMLVIHSQKVTQQLRGYMQVYEKESVKVIDKEKYEIPSGVTRQVISGAKKRRIYAVMLVNWMRFLM